MPGETLLTKREDGVSLHLVDLEEEEVNQEAEAEEGEGVNELC